LKFAPQVTDRWCRHASATTDRASETRRIFPTTTWILGHRSAFGPGDRLLQSSSPPPGRPALTGPTLLRSLLAPAATLAVSLDPLLASWQRAVRPYPDVALTPNRTRAFLQSLPLTEVAYPFRGRWHPMQSSTIRGGVCSWLHVVSRQAARRRQSFQHEPRLIPSPSGTLAVTSLRPLHLLRSFVPFASPFTPPRRTGLEADALLNFHPSKDSPLASDPRTRPDRHRPSSSRPSSTLDSALPASEPDSASCTFLTVRDSDS